ncbi:hypothetical protein [Methanosarcina mazei]|uniref:Uncharacterized protein n=1 Tax=Methanosarcina mazei TaxID=2209 RepID=A0A0F8NH98_METMZ|nr:hypothetical protein [Methanosarcina mazei]KKH15820.1 hypothetical protein DU48_11895 [Methanosarcina mazei]KKH17136.1 hypothetical protein DU65_12965 [Methanosarcina mazei]KKH17337.1 hypothetical protein DU44_12710 [Methanosarcina mazei]
MTKPLELDDRVYGFEFSGLEYQIIFKGLDMGFVRYIGRSKSKFYFTPLPFTNENRTGITYYLDEGCPAPEPKKLILVTHSEEFIEKKQPEDNSLFFQTEVSKVVKAWEEKDPNTIFRRRNLLYEDYVNYFQEGFRANAPDVQIEPISCAMAIYSASSPVLGANEKGGINAALRYGKEMKLWTRFIDLVKIVPRELKQTTSPCFFKYAKEEQIINPLASEEVNLAYPDPKELLAQIPISLLRLEADTSDSYKKFVQETLPHVRAYELDALLFTPDITHSADKWMEEAIYELQTTIEQSEFMNYNQDMGMALPKISASLARLHFDTEIKKEHIKEAFETWGEAYQSSFYWDTRAASPENLIKARRLGMDAKKLYFHILEHYSIGELIPKSMLRETGLVSEFCLDDAISSLLKNGAIYYPDLHHFKLIEIRNDVWQR